MAIREESGCGQGISIDLERPIPAPQPKSGGSALFVVTVAFEIAQADAEAFLTRVRRQAADSLAREPGCRRFDVATDPERPGRVLLFEIYDDRAAFDAHLATDHFRAFEDEVAPLTRTKEVAFWELQRPG